MRVLALITEAFGGSGGIAKFNRDMLKALCSCPGCDEVVALPRVIRGRMEDMPQNLNYMALGAGSKLKFMTSVLRTLAKRGTFSLIVCGHLHHLPAAYLCKLFFNAPLLLIIHGIDAWQPTRSRTANALTGAVDGFVSVSEFTRKKFISWAGVDGRASYVLPNCVDISRYGTGDKDLELLDRYRLRGKRVLMTLGRMSLSEPSKGFSEVMHALPEIIDSFHDLVYLVVGDGDARPFLENQARELGIYGSVVFTGFVSEAEKAAHYRLADVFVMPSRGEGFGIVFLEAMACGVPVIGSRTDGGSEVLLGGELGRLVDPDNRKEIIEAIKHSLAESKKVVPRKLHQFNETRFSNNVHEIINNFMLSDV